MSKLCPHCDRPLVPLQLFIQGQGVRVSGLPYADADERPSLLWGFETRGVVHGARCPRCSQVFLFAFPGEQGTHAHAAAAFEQLWGGPQAPPPELPSEESVAAEWLAIFEDVGARPTRRERALEQLIELGPEEVWLAAIQRTAPRLPPNSELVSLCARRVLERTFADVATLRTLGLGSDWSLRLQILERLEKVGGDGVAEAICAILGGALEENLPTVARAALAAASRLGAHGELVPLLLRCLDSTYDELVVDAIYVLGEHGPLDATAAIRHAGTGFFRPAAIKDAAQVALGRLRERFVVAPNGALSVTPDDATRGALSPTDDHAGLSLVTVDDEDPPG